MVCKLSGALVAMVALVVVALGADLEQGEQCPQGTWRPTSAEMAGQKFPDDVLKTIKLVVKDDKYTVTVGSAVDQGTVKVDAAAKPKTMDITGTEGPNKGKTMLAIYEQSGDTLRICYDLSGKARPSEFKTKPGTQQFLVTYQREKP